DLRHQRAEAGGAPRSAGYRRDRRARATRAAGRGSGRRARRQGDPEFLARRAEGPEGRQAEECGSHRVAREPVVLSGAGGSTEWLAAGASDQGPRTKDQGPNCRTSTTAARRAWWVWEPSRSHA